jgi:hypothetical protein
MPFVGLLALSLLVITYVPRISNQLVLGDIQKWRDQAEKDKRPPTEAWFLECVQLDRNNPQPCSEEDKKKFPKGQMPETAQPVVEADAGKPPSGDDDEDLSALIGGKEAGAGEAGAGKKPGEESDDDLLDMIKSAGKDASAEGAAPKKPAGQESDDDLLNEIKGTK